MSQHGPTAQLFGYQVLGALARHRYAIVWIEYYNCELPRVQELMQDPEQFYLKKTGERIVLDEIHVLQNPSIVLKVAADHFPDTKVIATGSSILHSQ